MSATSVRYKRSVDPVYTDGRDIDIEVAELTGEAGHQKADGSGDKHLKEDAWTWSALPEPKPADPTYYERPLLNESVWSWAVPAYYYIGGLAGGALVIAAAVQLKRPKRFERLIKRCHLIGFIGCCVSGALLVYDLGRPARFLNMLRVFRPTSPMNVGAWILTGTSGAAFTAVTLRDFAGVLGALGETAGYAAGLLGMGLATYTGVLIGNTAVPIWQASRRFLPILFAAGAATSVGSLFEIIGESPEESRITKSFGTIGEVAELTSAFLMEHHASAIPRVGRPFKRGWSAVLWRTATALAATSLVLGLLPNKTRKRELASGILGTVGSLMLRFAVDHAGNASARDPRSSFHQQRNQNA